MNCTDAFPYILKKKIDKTGEARGGKGIYKRRNSRTYRAIMQLTTYKKIIETDPDFLSNFKRGYVVRIKPNEYFTKNGKVTKKFPKTLTLGHNAFIYFKTIRNWNKYKKYCKNWEEIVELYTKSESIPNDDQWIGQYCLFINNANPKKISPICGSRNNATYINSLKTKYNLQSIPAQTGLGNFDYDYANDDEIKKVKYQLSYMIFKIPKMKKYLIDILNKIPNKELNINIQKSKNNGTISQYINNVIKHVEKYCKENNLLKFDTLNKIRAWDNKTHEPICPLCRKSLTPEEFFKTASQDEGREEEDNTQAEIVLMHIKCLKPRTLNHHTYNLGWGHKHCNTIQGPYDIKHILSLLKNITENEYS